MDLLVSTQKSLIGHGSLLHFQKAKPQPGTSASLVQPTEISDYARNFYHSHPHNRRKARGRQLRSSGAEGELCGTYVTNIAKSNMEMCYSISGKNFELVVPETTILKTSKGFKRLKDFCDLPSEATHYGWHAEADVRCMLPHAGKCPKFRIVADNTIEEWVPVPEWEHKYEVSSEGQVRLKASKKLIAQSDVFGRLAVYLQDDETDKTHVHATSVLVCTAFHGPCPAYMECCHLNPNTYDNRARFLRWDYRFKNHADKHLHGTAQVVKEHSRKIDLIRNVGLQPTYSLEIQADNFVVGGVIVGVD